MTERYAIAAFRSRSQLMRFEKLLKENNIKAEVIATPQRVKLGCGALNKIGAGLFVAAKADIYAEQFASIVDFYIIEEENGVPECLGAD